MTDKSKIENFNPELDLIIERTVETPPELVWAAWTEPKHLIHWFTPAPWKTIECDIDLKPGGIFHTVMQSPENTKHDNVGSFLEIDHLRKLVFTDTLQPGYRPAANPFFTAILFFEPSGTGTKYTAIARHKDMEDCNKHKDMGFHPGWNAALDQLVAYMKQK
jgi:uncharacterized protein YndB with AHSA1/START domain